MAMEDKIRDYLKFKMPHAEDICITNLEKIVGGSSRENISFEAEWTEEGCKIARSFIIRRDPVASLLETDREMEFRVLHSLEPTPVPVAKVYWLEPDEKWLERPFCVMEKMSGSAIPPMSRMRLFAPEDPELRAKIAKQFVEILAQIHTLDWKGLGLSFLAVPQLGTDAARREIEKWEQVIEKHKLEPQPILTEALLWLKNNKPETERIMLVHGDFKQDNLLYEDEKITAFLDWEMSHLGDPMEDLGWACMEWWRQDTPLICGLIDKEEFFRYYEELSGIKVDKRKVFFYQVLGCVKMSAIILTGVRSFSEGKSRDITLGLLGLVMCLLENEVANLLGF
jgi:aminoglycoside phosphotransferase (APT) family kinase protein